MKDSLGLARTVEARWATLRGKGETLEHRPHSTIEPPVDPPDTKGGRALEVLQELGRDVVSGTPLEMRETLGEGGMGIVRLAHQRSVGRDVAVKTLRVAGDAAAALRLLREAWVTGALEHPNVVPVYDVAVGADGAPMVVLKKIEGLEWSHLLADEATVRTRFGVSDVKEWHLRVLVQVCNAIHFAHARGIVHRDIKPENVMIGGFGEVYVVDWGIAVSLRDDGNGRLPLASSARDLAGTPAYMAPEMLGMEDGPPLSVRTDVYLLGATLFEVVVGRPPHLGDDLVSLFASVLASPPEVPPSVPNELADLCRRAMAHAPEDRLESAEAMKRGVEEYLRHRESMRLADKAQRRLNELLDELRDEEESPGREMRLHDLLGECRFGFRAALDAWPGNEAARGALRLALITMAEREARRGDARAAAMMAAEVEDPPSRLMTSIQAAREREAKNAREVEKLRAMAEDMDAKVGSRTRTFVMFVLGVLWTTAPLVGHFYGGSSVSHEASILIGLGFVAVAAGMGLWARESMMRSRINRTTFAIVIFTLMAQVVLRGATMLMGMDPKQGLVLHFFLWFSIAGAFCIFLDRRFIPAAVGYLFCFFASSLWHELTFPLISLGNFVLTVNALWLWAPLFSIRKTSSGP